MIFSKEPPLDQVIDHLILCKEHLQIVFSMMWNYYFSDIKNITHYDHVRIVTNLCIARLTLTASQIHKNDDS